MEYMEQDGLGALKPTVKPVVDATNTEALWRERAGKGYFVKVQATQTASRRHGLLPVQFIEDGDHGEDNVGIGYGRLETVQGSGSNFSATVLLLNSDGNVEIDGSEAELTDAQIGDILVGGNDGKLRFRTANESDSTHASYIKPEEGIVRVVGGHVPKIRGAWNHITNVR